MKRQTVRANGPRVLDAQVDKLQRAGWEIESKVYRGTPIILKQRGGFRNYRPYCCDMVFLESAHERARFMREENDT